MATDAVDLLTGLLTYYSPTGSEADAVDYLTQWMSAHGFTAQVDSVGNAIGSRGSGANEIILLGHIDTVPGEINVHTEGDALYGRGAVDAKGPLACFAAAVSWLPVIPPDWRVTVIGAVGEEGDSRGAHFLCSRPTPRYCIIGEPSSWDHLTLGYKGSAWVDVQVERTLSHSAAAPASASEAAVYFWNRMTEARAAWNTGRERQFDQLSASLRAMNSSTDGFTETARLRINFRLPQDMPPPHLQAWLTPLLGEGTLEVLDSVPCYRAEKNTALVRAGLAAIRAEGGKPGFLLKTGTSDMNLVGPAWGCPILAYGPGDSSLDHTPHEHIQISEYQKSVQILESMLGMLMA